MRMILALAPALVLSVLAGAAQAECTAVFKAKRGNPMQLQRGTIQLPDRACGSKQAAAAEISRRIGKDGWTLLEVVSVSGG